MAYNEILRENENFINATWLKLDAKLSRTAIKSRYKLPYTTVNGEHDDRSDDILWWTNGFWGGLMWLMYLGTGKNCYKKTAKISEKKMDEAFNHMQAWHHDVGFIWHILSGANYRITGDEKSKNRNIIAAMSLMSRYNVSGGYIRCWNGKLGNEDVAGWSIIDCMMNIPILYWASDLIGDTRFKKVAIAHADMSMRDHVRADGSVNHIVMHDTESPKVLGVKAGQGYSETSCWSRGDAWALYGFVLSYIHTKEQRYLDTALKVADYFIKETEKTDWLPRLDFCQPETPVYYDSTAGAIAACGLIEIAKNIKDGDKYLNSAINILAAMEKAWCDWSDKDDGVLQMGSEAYYGRKHLNIIYGDYFFTEAMLKLKNNDFLVW